MMPGLTPEIPVSPDLHQTLPEDDVVTETLEDRSATAVQRRCRGNWARKYAAWYKKKIQQVKYMPLLKPIGSHPSRS